MWPERAVEVQVLSSACEGARGRPFSSTRIVREMRRFLTPALVLGLSTLIAVGLVDALRGGPIRESQSGTTAPDSEASPGVEIDVDLVEATPPWVEDRAGLADRLRRNGVRGTLYLSAPDCSDGRARPLRALHLPELELGQGPSTPYCRFTVSAEGDGAARREVVWSPSLSVYTGRTDDGLLEVVDLKSPGRLLLSGSAAAFKPDGTLSLALSKSVIEWSGSCVDEDVVISPPVELGNGGTGAYCLKTDIPRRELTRALPSGRRLESVDSLAWLGRSRLLAVLQAGGASWIAPYEAGRSLGYANGLVSHSRTAALADPTGDYVALTPAGYLEVYDRDAFRVWASSIETADFDWSPDGDWLAYAGHDRNVYFVRTSDWTTRFSLRASTEGLAWR